MAAKDQENKKDGKSFTSADEVSANQDNSAQNEEDKTKNHTDDPQPTPDNKEDNCDNEEVLMRTIPKRPNNERTWKKSTLQNVLVQYGMTEHDGKPQKTQGSKNTSNKPKRKQTESKFAFEDDRDDDRQAAKREHNLQVYREVQMVRDCYYNMYMQKLREKVESQREDIRKKSDAIENRIRAKEEQDRRDSHRVKKRLEKHTLHHNEDFVNRVPKSNYYKILAVQNKLDSEGMLRTQEERDEFWADVRRPNMLNKYLSTYNPLPDDMPQRAPSYKGSVTHSTRHDSVTQPRSRTSSCSAPTTEKPAGEYRPMTQIAETRESSRPATREVRAESAATQKAKEPRKLDPHTVAKLAAAELDKKYPQMELPPMACFDMDFGDDILDPDKVLEDMEVDHRRKERKLFIKRLRRMYHLSQSNKATAQRIMTGHFVDDQPGDLHNPAISDIIAIDWLHQDIEDTLGAVRGPRQGATPPRPWTRQLATPPSSATPPAETRTSSGRSRHSRGSSAKSAPEKPEAVVLPLSLGVLTRENTKVVEAKCMSSLWTNYLQVGTSKFAPVQS